jgi:hypothetical protein
MSTLCLEFATSSAEEYRGSVARLASYVADGGFLFMAVSIFIYREISLKYAGNT